MKRSTARRAAVFAAVGILLASASYEKADAVGVLYANPGWAYSYDGDAAFYNDPDGPNPDYVNGDDQNQAGGRNGTAALVDPGIVCDPDCHIDNNAAEWIHAGQQWDGSAPGDPLGGTPTGTLFPPLPPAAPGGVATYNDGSGTSFLRMQDAGLANSYGWPDKDAQIAPGEPRQEGNNRRMLFGHNLANDVAFSGNTAVLDNGITLSFRIRLSTKATGPLDDIFFEGGATLGDTAPWPDDGLGYEVSNNGRGMVMVTQTKPTIGFNQMAFSLLDDDTVTNEGLTVNVGAKRGLVMNNRWNSNGSVNLNDATPATANVFEIPDEELDDWQEFWLTIQQLPAPLDGNTHEISVYHNGSITPETFEAFLSSENEFGSSAFLGMGLSSDSRQGAFDLDFIAYKEGVHVPKPPGLPGDFNNDGFVDAADYVVWRKHNGTTNTLPNDDDLGAPISAGHFDLWEVNFGRSATGGVARAAPEPSSASLLGLAIISIGVLVRFHSSTLRRLPFLAYLSVVIDGHEFRRID